MIIINADDWGRSVAETDAIASCYRRGAISSTSAMVFMPDSERAAELARELGLPVGLHLNLSESLTGPGVSPALRHAHDRVARFLTANKYAQLLYNPLLRSDFRTVVDAQLQGFERLYGEGPRHLDGHQHQHLCANVLVDALLPRHRSVRRSFSFWRGEKSGLNRAYRSMVDRWLARRHPLADYFFSLESCLKFGRLARVFELASAADVELMTHPIRANEFEYLMSGTHLAAVARVRLGQYSDVSTHVAVRATA